MPQDTLLVYDALIKAVLDTQAALELEDSQRSDISQTFEAWERARESVAAAVQLIK